MVTVARFVPHPIHPWRRRIVCRLGAYGVAGYEASDDSDHPLYYAGQLVSASRMFSLDKTPHAPENTSYPAISA